MPQDYAKRNNARAPSRSLPGWVWFLTGLATGLLSAFLFYLWRDVPIDPEAAAIVEKPSPELAAPPADEMKWDFYDIFPKSEVPVEEYAKDGSKSAVATPSVYLLQAGSFRNQSDADRLRAELILLGMDVIIKPVTTEGQTWHRVLVGPVKSDLEADRLRRRLAEQNIASIPIKVSP
ncbi:MAG: SPOR domain-containing protein [Pseudomonadales bacterium]|nr:SPOR domain-containing protein [Pseudomonadales bacterium]